METPKCKECGGPTKCYCYDTGVVDYYDVYVLHCETCGKIEREFKHSGTPSSNYWPTICPYCGRTYVRHNKAPVELRDYQSRFLPRKN